MFLTAPDWNQPSISFDSVAIEYASSAPEINYVSSIKAKSVQLQLAYGINDLKQANWANFTNCERLEVRFLVPNCDKREEKVRIMKLIQHQNLHVLIDEPFEVNDACPPSNLRYWSDYKCGVYWKKADVDNFVKSIATSPTKTLTYTLESHSRNPKTVRFDCDEQFLSTFMAFLDTQPIYTGNDFENYVTCGSARQSFLQ